MNSVLGFLPLVDAPMDQEYVANHTAYVMFQIIAPIKLRPAFGGNAKNINVWVGEFF